MTGDARTELLEAVRASVGDRPRPARFTRDTCDCEECRDHEAELQTLDPDDPSLEALGNPAWDPICFASDTAFAYLLPGLVRLVLTRPDDYVQQFVFHVGQPDRLATLDPDQARALVRVLDHLVLHEAGAVDRNRVAGELLLAREHLERSGS